MHSNALPVRLPRQLYPPDHLGGKGMFKIVQRTSKMLPRAARMCPGGLSPLGNFLGILLLARSWHSWLVSASKTPPTASKTPSKTEHNGLLLRLWPYTEGGLAVVRPRGASSIRQTTLVSHVRVQDRGRDQEQDLLVLVLASKKP